jgi:cytoskeleton protein RodZ
MSEFAPVIVDNDAPAPRPGPGARLQAARLERQLDVASVALAMHVSPHVVEALEQDRFEVFDAPVYARGYLRSYARFLNLSVDEVLAAYDEVVGSQPPPSLLPPASARPLPRDYSALKKAGLLVFALLLVVASYWWWMGRVAPPAAQAVPPAASATTNVVAEPAALTDGDSPADLVLPTPESVSLIGTSDASPGVATAPATLASPPATTPARMVTAQPMVAAAPAGALAVKPAAATASTTPPITAAPIPAAGHGVTPAPASIAPAPIAAPTPTPTPVAKTAPLAGQSPPPLVASVSDGPQIVLRGKKDCWVEVRAAGGARLFYGLVRPGETHTMPGPAPWFVFLGYADGIDVSVGGHLVEVPAARREGAKARFGLAADGTLR